MHAKTVTVLQLTNTFFSFFSFSNFSSFSVSGPLEKNSLALRNTKKRKEGGIVLLRAVFLLARFRICRLGRIVLGWSAGRHQHLECTRRKEWPLLFRVFLLFGFCLLHRERYLLRKCGGQWCRSCAATKRVSLAIGRSMKDREIRSGIFPQMGLLAFCKEIRRGLAWIFGQCIHINVNNT